MNSLKLQFAKNIPLSILNRIKDFDLAVPSRNAHEAIEDALSKSVLIGGKRLRPLLTYLFANLYGLELSKVDTCAKSIEMVHAASLAHDDVIDEATTRRGVPSINIQTSNKKAILAGDYLLSAVIGGLCEFGRLDLVKEMANVIELLSQGEWLQSDLVESREYSRELLSEVALKKTSSVMTWCSVAPAIIANLSDEQIELSRAFGHHLGLAFQLLDDTFDFKDDGEKDQLLDLKNGQVNAVLFEWFKFNPELWQAFLQGEDVTNSFNDNGLNEAIELVRKEACSHLDKCRDILDQLFTYLSSEQNLDQKEMEKRKEPLLFLLSYLENRDF